MRRFSSFVGEERQQAGHPARHHRHRDAALAVPRAHVPRDRLLRALEGARLLRQGVQVAVGTVRQGRPQGTSYPRVFKHCAVLRQDSVYQAVDQ